MPLSGISQSIRHQVPEQRSRDYFAPPTDVVPGPYFRWKSIPDRIAAALLLIPGSLIIALLIVAVRLTSRGPAIFRQIRTGKNGRPFTMLKIRTMVVDAEANTGAVWAKRADPRITWLGRILRKLHLDEFPQLYNVLRGDMAFVGPRPERPEFVAVLTDALPGYENRLAVLPGITGLAQINLPPDSDLESVRRKLALDLAYIQEAGPSLDTRMFFCTFGRVLGIPGAFVTLLFGLRRHVIVTPCDDETESLVNGQMSDEPVTPARLSSARKITVAKYSIAQAIGARLSFAMAVIGNGTVNGNGNGNGHGNGNGNGNGNGRSGEVVPPVVIGELQDGFAESAYSALPQKPR